MFTITLSWPPRSLSPNGRAHFRQRAADARTAKNEAYVLTLAALGGRAFTAAGPLSVRLLFHPPRLGRYDDDNFIAACKPALDGISAALGVDDSTFQIERPAWGDVQRRGLVEVWIGKP